MVAGIARRGTERADWAVVQDYLPDGNVVLDGELARELDGGSVGH